MKRVTFYFVAGLLAIVGGFIASYWGVLLGLPLCVVSIAVSFVLAVRSRGYFSVWKVVLLGLAGSLVGTRSGRLYFDHAVVDQLPRLRQLVDTRPHEAGWLALAGDDARFTSSVMFPDSSRAAAVFLLTNGERLEYVPAPQDWPRWRGDKCVRELAERWYVRTRCD